MHPIRRSADLRRVRNWREHDLEKGHVVVKNIPVLHEPAGPCPDYVHVLRFVAVEPVANHVHELERDHESKQARGGQIRRGASRDNLHSVRFHERKQCNVDLIDGRSISWRLVRRTHLVGVFAHG